MSTTSTTPAPPSSPRLVGAERLALFSPVKDFSPLADRKSGALLTANGLLVSVTLLFYERIELALAGGHPRMAPVVVGLLCALIPLFLGGGYAAFRSLTVPVPSMPGLLTSFTAVATMSYDQYRAAVCAVDHRRVLHDVLMFNHAMSRSSSRKFRLLNQSVRFFRVAILLWMALIAALAVVRG